MLLFKKKCNDPMFIFPHNRNLRSSVCRDKFKKTDAFISKRQLIDLCKTRLSAGYYAGPQLQFEEHGNHAG